MKLVIALGGNAILKKGEKPAIETQFRNTKNALKKLFPIFKNNKVVITHGNGPQAGYLLLQQEIAREKISEMPLDVLDAETEGQTGYIIQQELGNLFRKFKINKGIATVLTQVLVDKNDPAFYNPTKFIGPFYTKSEADRLKNKFTIKEDVGRGWRRVVPSPKPIKVIETKVIDDILDKAVAIAAGGGGIPVIKKGDELEGIEAVIDKDLASQCLANSINADLLIMITDIDKVYLNYKKQGQKALGKVKLEDMKRYYKEGHFPAGSMGPKIEAAINFLENGGKKVIITDIPNIEKAMKEKGGTVIVR